MTASLSYQKGDLVVRVCPTEAVVPIRCAILLGRLTDELWAVMISEGSSVKRSLWTQHNFKRVGSD